MALRAFASALWWINLYYNNDRYLRKMAVLLGMVLKKSVVVVS